MVLIRAAGSPIAYSSLQELVAAALEVYDVPGEHHTIALEPNVKALAERLRACLDGRA